MQKKIEIDEPANSCDVISVVRHYKNLIWGSVLDGSFQPKG